MDKIVILHGVNDLYLSNQKMMQKFKDLGIKVIEVEDAGHNWHANFDKEILKIINS